MYGGSNDDDEPQVKSESYAPQTKRKTKRNTSLTAEEIKERRMKHNQVEIRRRQRIKSSFQELGNMCGVDSKQKRIILSSAIELIKEYEEKILDLQSAITTLDADEKGAGGGAGLAAASSGQGGGMPGAMSVSGAFAVGAQTAGGVDHGSIFHSSGVPLHIAAFDGRVLDCNEAFAQLFGFTRQGMLEGQSAALFSLVSPDSLSVSFGVLGSLMNGRPSVQANLTIVGAGGVHRRVKLTAWSVREDSKPKYFMGMMLLYPENSAEHNSLAQDQVQAALPGLQAMGMPAGVASGFTGLQQQQGQGQGQGQSSQQQLQMQAQAQQQQQQHQLQLQQMQQQLQQQQQQQQQQQLQ